MNQYTKDLVVLFVEDDVSVRETFTRILKRFFKSVHVYENGSDAFEFFKEHHAQIDVVVTDITMPKMSGIELVHQMRQMGSTKPVVAFTAQYDSISFRDTINETFDEIIPKTASQKFVVEIFEKIGKKIQS